MTRTSRRRRHRSRLPGKLFGVVGLIGMFAVVGAAGAVAGSVISGSSVSESMTASGSAPTGPLGVSRSAASQPGASQPAAEPAAAVEPAVVGPPACSAVLQVVQRWPGGLKAEVTVSAATSAVHSWRVGWPRRGAPVPAQWWDVALTSSGTDIAARNASWNGSLPAGGRTTFGFIATDAQLPAGTLTCVAG